MAYSAGTAYLEIVPSFLNVESLIAAGARDIAKGLDKALAGQLGKAVKRGTDSSEREVSKSGTALGRTFAESAMRRIQSSLSAIPATDRILKPLRAELTEISKIDITKGFDEKDFIARVERAYTALRKAQQDAQGVNAVGRYTNAGNAAQELGAVKDIVEQARKRGFLAGDAFSDAYQNRLKAMDRILPDLKITAKSGQEDRAVAALKARVADALKLQVGDAATTANNPLNLKIGARIDGEDLKREMASIEGLLDQFVERFNKIELVLPLDKARQQAGGFFTDIQTQAEKAAEEQGKAYLKAYDDALAEQARRDRKASQDLENAHAQAIGEDYKRRKKIQDDFLRDFFSAEAEDYKRRLRARQQFDREWDAATAENYKREKKAQTDFLRDWDSAMLEARRRQQKAAADLAQEADRARQQTTGGDISGRLSKAASRIVDLPVHLQANDIDKEMAALRARIKALGDLQIGIDIDVESAADQVEAEFSRLRQIAGDKNIDIDIRVDAARAATELGGILALVNRIDGDKAEVKVDTDGAATGLRELFGALGLNLGRLGGLIALGSSLGTSIVPAAAAAASAIGGIGTAAFAAGSGIGVMLLAFSGIGDAVKALSQYADDQAKSNASLARSSNQVVAANEQIKSAEAALANTRRNNAEAARKAARAIIDALRDQKDAIRDVREANQDAQERVIQAQNDLRDADEAERASRLKLTEAYREAERALKDLFFQIRGNALSQRQAVLDIAEAKAELDKLLANPRATEAEREQARITYEQRLLQMDELQAKATELDDEQNKRWRDGIEKSKEVVAARDEIKKADQARDDAAKALAKAEQDRDRIRLDGVRKLEDAQRKVDDSRRAAADQRRDAAYAEFTATQSLLAARRALDNAQNSSASAGGAQLDNLNQAMAKLSPTARNFARYLFGLRDVFYELRAAADPVLAGIQRGMTKLFGKTSDEAKVKLAPLFDFVRRVAGAIGESFDKAADALKGPTFTKFFKYLSKTAVPTIKLLYQSFENLTTGLLNLFLAFTPLSDDFNGGFLEMTESFRKWSEGLDKNKGFQDFIAYLKKSGPAILSLIKEIALSVGKFIVAAAPIGLVVVKGFTKLFDLINKIPEKTLTTLVAGIGAAAAALGTFALITAAAGLSVAGLVAGAIAVLVVAFSALIGSSGKAQKFLGELWKTIQIAGALAFFYLKRGILALRPVFDDMVEAALSFYNDGLKPAFDAVKTLLTSLYTTVRPYFDDIGGFFTKLGGLAFYLYDKAILPAFKGIMTVVHELFDVVKPVFDVIGVIIGTVAGIVFWLLNRVFLPVIGGIVKLLVTVLTPVIRWLWLYIVRPIFRSIGLAIQIAAAIIKVAIGIVMIAIKILGKLFEWLYKNMIKPVWDQLVNNVFKPMGEWWEKTIAPKWKKGIAALGKIWEGFKKIIGVPIKFIVETLLNDGLLKGYNWLADKFDVEPKNVKIPAPKGGWTGFAAGGAVNGRGTGTSDSIRARLSRGEHVLTAKEVQAAGGHDVIYALRREILSGRLGMPGFAKGGEVGFGDWLTGIGKNLMDKGSKLWDKGKQIFGDVASFLANPSESLKTLFQAMLQKLPGNTVPIVKDIVNVPRKILGGLIEKVKNLIGIGGGTATGSGVAGEWPRSPGAQRGDSGVWRQVVNVIKGSGIKSGSFGNGYRPGDPLWHGSGRAVDWMGFNQDALASYLAARRPLELIHRTKSRDYAYTRGKNKGSFNQALMNAHKNHIHIAFDNGGLLPDTRNMPGGVMSVFHGNKIPDKVLTDAQWRQMATLANKAQATMAGGDTWNFEFRDTTLDAAKMAALQARRDALNRVARSNF